MRRWNGWGDDKTTYHLPDSALAYLAGKIGVGQRLADVTFEQALKSVPLSRLLTHPLITTDAVERLRHARGQSLPDWVACRSGQIETFPDGVAYPQTEAEVRNIIQFAIETGTSLIPYGGGTSVVGHINPLPSDVPVLMVNLSHLNQLEALDETDWLATFGAGVCGPGVEAQLNPCGFTLGHFPQSFELSTLGGWIATRSSGQQSYHYGRIENLFAGGHVETAQGALELPPMPASAAGPDLRQLILGSEGRLGIITRASVRVRPIPQQEAFYSLFFHSWENGVQAVRQIVQSDVAISMARLSNPQETETTLRLSGKDSLVAWAERGLGWLGYPSNRSLLVLGITGDRRACRQALRRSLEIARQNRALYTAQPIGKIWRKSRFLTPYLRNTLWELGYAIDTFETALPWTRILTAEPAVLGALRSSLEKLDEHALIFAHLSHVYRDGASLYTTCIFRRAAEPEGTLSRWQAMKSAVSKVIVDQGGTISHQHGVGIDHAQYLPFEKGPLGMDLLRSAARTLDPDGCFNPGKLILDDPQVLGV